MNAERNLSGYRTTEEPQLEEHDEEAVERAAAKDSLLHIGPQLASQGVAEVRLSYVGNADARYFGKVVFLDSEGSTRDPSDSSQLHVTVEVAVETLLPLGWELDEGSFGEFVMRTSDAHLFLNHAWRFTVLEEETIEL